jgi:hypothetical protein
MPTRSERLEILNRVEKGEISTEEAARLLSVTVISSPTLPQTPMSVLEQLERGEITPEDAARRLSAPAGVKQNQEKKTPKVEVIRVKPTATQRSSGWWLILISIGALFAVLGGLLMNTDLRNGGMGLGFFCAWIPLSFGVLLLLLGWLARRSAWANVNFKSHRANGRVKFDFDMPVPIGVAGKALHFVGDRVPVLGSETVERLMQALEQASKDGDPIQIRANSEDGDDSVDITIS